MELCVRMCYYLNEGVERITSGVIVDLDPVCLMVFYVGVVNLEWTCLRLVELVLVCVVEGAVFRRQ